MKALVMLWVLCCVAPLSWASERGKLEKIEIDTSFAARARGVDQVMTVCRGCHSMKYIKYRDLANLGIAADKITEWRAGQPLSAHITSQMPGEVAAAAFGNVPPDLSLIVQARADGIPYVYSFLLGFYITPAGLPDNHVFPETKMPDVMGVSGASAAQRAEIGGRARDIVSFLNWAADPHEEERHRLGYYVIAYLILLTVLLYLVKRQIWARLK